MFPDNVETITMTKENYDRNVEQLLFDKIDLEIKIEKAIKYIENILEDASLNEEDYIIALYKILNDLKGIENE